MDIFYNAESGIALTHPKLVPIIIVLPIITASCGPYPPLWALYLLIIFPLFLFKTNIVPFPVGK